jgi:hypothetical protein
LPKPKGHLEHQRRIIAELDRDGHDTAHAKALLDTFEQSYALTVADRNRLREQLKSQG